MKKVLTLVLAALLVVSSTGFALAQDPVPAVDLVRVDPLLTGDGSGYIAVPATSRLAAASSMAAVTCGAPEDYVIAWDTSNGATPLALANHGSLITGLQAKDYIVGTIDISTEEIPDCVDTLVITSLKGNSCLVDYPAGTYPERDYALDGRITLIKDAVEMNGLSLLLLGESGLEGAVSSCGYSTSRITKAFGPVWLGNGDNFAFTFTEGTHFYNDSPPSLFHNIGWGEMSKVSTHSTWEGVVLKTLTSAPDNGIMIAKEYGSGCAVFVGDTGWTTDFSYTGDYYIDRGYNRALAHNVFGYLENCGLWADPNGPYSGYVGSEIQFDGTGSQDARGEPITSYAWDFGDDSTDTGAEPTHTYATAGDYIVCLTISTGSGRTDTNCTTAGIIPNPNLPPVADPNGPYLEAAGTPIDFDGSDSSDPDGDALTYAWDFGDGNTGTGESPSHTYGFADIYDVCVIVNDGTVDSEEVCTQAVVYDRSEGFATGSGKFDSPDGASAAGAGDTQFSFVARYQKGGTVPTGGASFVFEAGGLAFESTSYEWLVVTGGNHATLKGTGTISGLGDCNFKIWAGDGEPDTFRIKIWDGDDEGVWVYDNGYDNGIGQAITSGNIVIHDNVK